MMPDRYGKLSKSEKRSDPIPLAWCRTPPDQHAIQDRTSCAVRIPRRRTAWPPLGRVLRKAGCPGDLAFV